MLVFILYCLFHQKWSINAIVLLHHYVSLERFVENNACISSLMWCWFLIWPLELILVIHLKPWDLFGRARRAAPKVILWGPLPNTENHSTPSHCHSLKWTKMLGTEKIVYSNSHPESLPAYWKSLSATESALLRESLPEELYQTAPQVFILSRLD